LFYWEGGKLSAFPDPTLAEDGVRALAGDALGNLWVGTKAGLRCYDANFKRQAVPPLPVEVKALLVDRNGRLWIGTTGWGLARMNNGGFSFFQKADGLAHENVTALFEDREGTLWVGTRDGLSQLSNVKLPIVSTQDGILGRGVHSVCRSKNGGIWAATGLGLSYYDRNANRNYSSEAGFKSAYLKQVYEARDGDVYVADGDKNIMVFAEDRVVACYATNNWPTAFAEDARGVLISIGDRIFRVSRTNFVPYEIDMPALPVNWIFNLAAGRDGDLLAGTANGVFRLNRGKVEHWTTQDGLSDNMVTWLDEDADGVLWAGLTTGIARIKGRQVTNIAVTNGLFDNFIDAMVEDDLGSFWINSTRGIFQISRRTLNDFAEGRARRVECTAYDDSESVKIVDTTEVEYSGCKTSDGRIWFPSPAGVIMVNPTNLVRNLTEPPIHILGVRANGSECARRDIGAVAPGRGDLEFQYSAPSFIAPGNVRFRYRLEGYDSAWVEAGPRRTAFYTNLKPGRYQFRVQACNADGIWNPDADSLEVQMLPWFYQTPWFKGACGLLVIALLAGLYRWRIQHLRQQQRKLKEANALLESKVRERTRELLDVSRQTGMFEVATNVLHNVGNLLNSVNVSGDLILNMVRGLGTDKFEKATGLLMAHQSDLASFLNHDEKGRRLGPYLVMLAGSFAATKNRILKEFDCLNQNIERINGVVSMQQNIADAAGLVEAVALDELVDDTLRKHEEAYQQQKVRIIREFSPVPPVRTDRYKLTRVLSNLLANAKDACVAKPDGERTIRVRLGMHGETRAMIEVADTGIGIAADNLVRIFSPEFNPKPNGRGLGLHSGALVMKSLGGTLTAASAGPGRGATFTLELPLENRRHLGAAPEPPNAGTKAPPR
jgi:signal transduction histidine kinase